MQSRKKNKRRLENTTRTGNRGVERDVRWPWDFVVSRTSLPTRVLKYE